MFALDFFFPTTERPSYAPPPPPAPTAVSIPKWTTKYYLGTPREADVAVWRHHFSIVSVLSKYIFSKRSVFCWIHYISNTDWCADTSLLLKRLFPLSPSMNASSFFQLLSLVSLIFCPGLPSPPSFVSFLIRNSVSFVSISKCPTLPGLWGTTHTATWPTTTTDWEGAKAATVG